MIIELKPQKNQSILDQLQDMDIQIPAACGGIGRCGRCRIRLIEGSLPVTRDDNNALGKERCEAGWRLACKAYPTAPVTIEVKEAGEAQILTDVTDKLKEADESLEKPDINCNPKADTSVYAAIDLGTTTVAILLYDENGRELGKTAFINPQTAFGADVISRVQASIDGKKLRLQELICKAISDELKKLLQTNEIVPENLCLIALAGNTTMLHLLRGYSCDGLTMHPFSPVNLDFEKLPAKAAGLDFPNAELHIFPGFTAFIGADIVAGVYGTGMHERLENRLLMDLGTNGEMVFGNRYELRAAAAAAGPAFEGGNLSCGMGAAKGAVSSVRLDITGKKPKAICEVIGNEDGPHSNVTAEGICGSGAVELLSEALNAALVDYEGTLIDDCFENGIQFANDEEGNPLTLTQKDIRELQLAKASVRAVAEMLTADSADYEILLAGGMGNGLDLEAIKTIGLVPDTERITPVGNTCLLGLKKYIDEFRNGRGQRAEDSLKKLATEMIEVPVAGEEEFQERFLQYMNFD